MKKYIALILLAGLGLSGCTTKTKTEEIMVTPTLNKEVSEEQLVGGDSDEHGCKASAGYSWCEAKQKCLRVWEEECEEIKVREAVAKILAKKYDITEDKVLVGVNKEIGGFASGSVGFGDKFGGGGWLAKKNGNEWEVVWDGNGSVDCIKLKTQDKFPDEILKPSFCD